MDLGNPSERVCSSLCVFYVCVAFSPCYSMYHAWVAAGSDRLASQNSRVDDLSRLEGLVAMWTTQSRMHHTRSKAARVQSHLLLIFRPEQTRNRNDVYCLFVFVIQLDISFLFSGRICHRITSTFRIPTLFLLQDLWWIELQALRLQRSIRVRLLNHSCVCGRCAMMNL